MTACARLKPPLAAPGLRPGYFTRMSHACGIDEDSESVTLKFQKPSTRYFNELLLLSCAPDLIKLGVYPNAKEITESMACFRAALRACGGMEHCGNDKTTAIIVGDGSTPRTAVLFAYRTRWVTWSIDPNLRPEWAGHEPYGTKRLHGFAKRIEQCGKVRFPGDLVLIFPHSHAPTEPALEKFTARGARHVVWLPCCVTPTIPNRQSPDEWYDDWGIWSPQRAVMIWKNI